MAERVALRLLSWIRQTRIEHEIFAFKPVRDATRLPLPEKRTAVPGRSSFSMCYGGSGRSGKPQVRAPSERGVVGERDVIMVGTSVRVVLALRRCEIYVASYPPTALVNAAIKQTKKQGTYRKPSPMRTRQKWRIALPSLTAAAVRSQLARTERGREAYLFAMKTGKPLGVSSYECLLRIFVNDSLGTLGTVAMRTGSSPLPTTCLAANCPSPSMPTSLMKYFPSSFDFPGWMDGSKSRSEPYRSEYGSDRDPRRVPAEVPNRQVSSDVLASVSTGKLSAGRSARGNPPNLDIEHGLASTSKLSHGVYMGCLWGQPEGVFIATHDSFYGRLQSMNKATRPHAVAKAAPQGRPPRRDLLIPMLEGTKRAFVPIRRSFIQKPRGTEGSRGSSLALLARDSFALDAYLLIHALASSSEPHVAAYPAATWVQLVRLDEAATFEAGKSRWSKVITKLASLRLIERERKGNEMQYRLLHEAGTGEEYVRPKKSGDGHWLRLPYCYWLEGFDATLSHPEKLMLLIALDQQDNFALPFNRAANWYGVSESTARRGLRGLESRDLLAKTSSFVPSPRSPNGWAEEFRYLLRGPFSKKAIDEAQAASRKMVRFTEAGAS